MKLPRALAQCSIGLLHKIADSVRLPTDAATLPAELVDRLTSALAQASSEGELWSGLAPEERVPIDLLVRSGGRHPADLLERRLRGALPGPIKGHTADPSQVLHRLLERGIVFRVFEGGSSTPETAYVLPDEYLDAARQAVAGSASVVRPAEGPPSDVRQNDPRRDCFVLASALRREIWNLPRRQLSGKPGPRLEQLLGRLRAAIRGPDAGAERERWAFFLRLGRRLGWLRATGWPVPDDQAVERILGEPDLAVREGWAAWLSDPRAGSRQMRAGGSHQQRDLLLLLGELSHTDWYRWEDLAAIAAPDLAEPTGSARAGLASFGSGPSARALGGGAGNAAELHRWLLGPWWWLGLVRWARERDAWTLLAPTAVLATLESGAVGVLPAPRPCRFVDDLGLIAPLTADLATLYRAERYLGYVGGVEPRRYRLTAATFARGVRLGGSVEEATKLFEDLQQGSLLAPWASVLGRWATTLKHVQVDAKLMLTAADPETLQRLLEVPGVLDGVDEVLSARHASIAAHELERLLFRLDEAGIPIDLSAGVRLYPSEPARAAAVGGDAAATLWLVLEAIERVDGGLLEELPEAGRIREGLEVVIPTDARADLERRADALAARLIAKRRAPGSR